MRMQNERANPNPQPAPQAPSPAPMPQRPATSSLGRARTPPRPMPIVFAAAGTAVVAFGAIATGLVQLPGSDSAAPAPITTVTQSEQQPIGDGDPTVAGQLTTMRP